MDNSLRDKIQDKIDLKTTAGDMETKLDTAKLGEQLGCCISTAAGNGVLTEFTFTHNGVGVTDIIEGSETVFADGTLQERGAGADYTFVGSTCTVTFMAGHIPASGNVYLNGTRETTW